jgi:cysteine synthase
MIYQNLSDIIGNTPLLRLNQLSDRTGCEILGKCEFMNPGGSIKDRTALGIVQAAEKTGELRPGATLVEGTAGNTGIGLALIANAKGYKTKVVMPMNQSREKIELLELLGVDLQLVQVTGYDDPNHYINTAQRIAEEMNAKVPGSAFWARQFDNTANRDFHYETTGQEIWAQTEGKVDGFVCSVGTGGTLAGVSRALREKNPEVKIGLADPMGSALYNYFTKGEFASNGTSITEGIGISHLTNNFKDTTIDLPLLIRDEEALPLLFDLLLKEGVCLGGSSGINMAGAKQMAEQMGPGHTIVTILCDNGTRYQSKIYNPAYLKAKQLPTPQWLR